MERSRVPAFILGILAALVVAAGVLVWSATMGPFDPPVLSGPRATLPQQSESAQPGAPTALRARLELPDRRD